MDRENNCYGDRHTGLLPGKVTMKKSLLAVCIIAFLFISCIEISYELKDTIPSETGNKIAYIYTSAGGATTGYATRVTVSAKKDFKIKVDWIDDNTILVSYRKGTRFFTKKQKFKDIKIRYTEIDE